MKISPYRIIILSVQDRILAIIEDQKLRYRHRSCTMIESGTEKQIKKKKHKSK